MSNFASSIPCILHQTHMNFYFVENGFILVFGYVQSVLLELCIFYFFIFCRQVRFDWRDVNVQADSGVDQASKLRFAWKYKSRPTLTWTLGMRTETKQQAEGWKWIKGLFADAYNGKCYKIKDVEQKVVSTVR